MRYEAYIRRLISRVFKLLPMREQVDVGVNLFLDMYISDLADEMTGAYITFPELYEDPNFVAAVNSMNYLRCHWEDTSFKTYRGIILKMTNSIAGIIGRCDDGSPK